MTTPLITNTGYLNAYMDVLNQSAMQWRKENPAPEFIYNKPTFTNCLDSFKQGGKVNYIRKYQRPFAPLDRNNIPQRPVPKVETTPTMTAYIKEQAEKAELARKGIKPREQQYIVQGRKMNTYEQNRSNERLQRARIAEQRAKDQAKVQALKDNPERVLSLIPGIGPWFHVDNIANQAVAYKTNDKYTDWVDYVGDRSGYDSPAQKFAIGMIGLGGIGKVGRTGAKKLTSLGTSQGGKPFEDLVTIHMGKNLPTTNSKALSFAEEVFGPINKKVDLKNDSEVRKLLEKILNQNLTVARGIRPTRHIPSNKLHTIAGVVPPAITGSGRYGKPINLEALYTTNSIQQALGYAYDPYKRIKDMGGKVFIMQPKLIEASNNLDFIQKNIPNMFEGNLGDVYIHKNNIPKHNFYIEESPIEKHWLEDMMLYKDYKDTYFEVLKNGVGDADYFRNKMNFYAKDDEDASKKLIDKFKESVRDLENSYLILDDLTKLYGEELGLELFDALTLEDTYKITKFFKENYASNPNISSYKEDYILKDRNSNIYISDQEKALSYLHYSPDGEAMYIKPYIHNPNSNKISISQNFGGMHHHYLHLGTPGQQLYTPIKEFSIAELMDKYKPSRLHSGHPSNKGLSTIDFDNYKNEELW